MGWWGNIVEVFENTKKGIEGAINVVIPTAPKVDPKEINPDYSSIPTPTKAVINEDALNKENKLLERFFNVANPFYSEVDEDKKPIATLGDDEKKLMRKVVVDDIEYLEKELLKKRTVININNSTLNSSEKDFVTQFIGLNRYRGQPNEERYDSNCYQKHYVEAVVKYHIFLEAANKKLNELGPLPEQKTQQPAPPPLAPSKPTPKQQPPRASPHAPAAGIGFPPTRHGAGGNPRRAPAPFDPSIGGTPVCHTTRKEPPDKPLTANQARQPPGVIRPEGYEESKRIYFEQFKKIGILRANLENAIKEDKKTIDSLKTVKGGKKLESFNPHTTQLLIKNIALNNSTIKEIKEESELFSKSEKDIIEKAYNQRKAELKSMPGTAPRNVGGVYSDPRGRIR